MLGHGSGTYVSKSLADKDTKTSSKYVSTAFFTGLLMGLLLMVVGLISLKDFMLLLGSTDTILPYAMDFGRWIFIASPFMICSLILNNNLRYEGKALFSMIGILSGGLLNILLDFLLIKVFNYGVSGAGIATCSSQIASCLILFFMHRFFAQSRISIKCYSKNISMYLDIIKAGFPSLIRQGLTSISSGVLNNLCKSLGGDSAISAMSVVNRFSMFVMCVGIGIGQGLQPVAAFNYRAKKYDRVKSALKFTIVFSTIFVSILSLFGLIIPEVIINIFQKDSEVVELGKFALRMASIGVIFLPMSVCANMLYQSIRRSLIASFLALLRSGLILIPLLFLLSNLFGIHGIMLSQPISDIITTLISIPFIIVFLVKTPKDNEKSVNN